MILKCRVCKRLLFFGHKTKLEYKTKDKVDKVIYLCIDCGEKLISLAEKCRDMEEK